VTRTWPTRSMSGNALVADDVSVGSAARKTRRKMGLTCIACRLSKIRCDAEDHDDNVCRRCTRLNLACSFATSRRGAANVKRDIARLGQALRPLLRGGPPNEPDSFTATSTVGLPPPTAIMSPRSMPASFGSRCELIDAITTPTGKLALLKHWLLIGKASNDCALIGRALSLGHQAGFAFSAFAPILSNTDPTNPPPLSKFMCEWFDDPVRACCFRSQQGGTIEVLTNPRFSSMVFEPLHARASFMDERVRRSDAEAFITTVVHPDDRYEVIQLQATLWSHASKDRSTSAATCQVEANANVPVRCQLNCTPGRVQMPSNGAQITYVSCILEGRLEYDADSRSVRCMYCVTPAAVAVPAVSMHMASVAPAPPLVANPIGLPSIVGIMPAEFHMQSAPAPPPPAPGDMFDLGIDLSLP